MVDVASLILEVSYGQATVVPRFRGAIQLAHNKDYYYHPGLPRLQLTRRVGGQAADAAGVSISYSTGVSRPSRRCRRRWW
jgi:hypothetical protein